MGIRIATSFSTRLFNLLITNVPGAQKQMYVAGTRLLETYAMPPLLPNQVLAIGVTSYNRMLYLGVNADREATSDPTCRRACCAICSMNCWKPPSESRPQYDAAMSKGGKKPGEKSAERSPKTSTKPNFSAFKPNS